MAQELSPVQIYNLIPGIKKFDGLGDVSYFITDIDRCKRDFTISNKLTATLASRCLEVKSTAETWYHLEVEKDILPNLDIWEPEEAVPGDPAAQPPVPAVAAKNGGLKKALKDKYSRTQSRAACERALDEAKCQKPNESFDVWATRLEKALYFYTLKAYPEAILATKANAQIMRDSQLRDYFWEGMSKPYLKYLEPKKSELVTPQDILTAAKEFENSRLAQDVSGVGTPKQEKAGTRGNPIQVGAVAKQQPPQPPKPDNKGKECSFCGIKDSHEEPDCNKKKALLRDGYTGARHPNYPLKSYKERQKQKKKPVASAAVGDDLPREEKSVGSASLGQHHHSQHLQSNFSPPQNGNFQMMPYIPQPGTDYQVYNQSLSPHPLAEYFSQGGRQ